MNRASSRLGRAALGMTFSVRGIPPGHPIPGYPDALRPRDRVTLHGALGRDVGPRYRAYRFDAGPNAGYTFRQFAGGEIWIVRSPRRKGVLPGIVKVSRTENPKAWASITQLIDDTRRGNRQAALNTAAKVAAAVAVEVLKQPRRSGKGAHAADVVPVEEVPLPEEEKLAIPWVPVAAGGALLLVLVAALSGGKG